MNRVLRSTLVPMLLGLLCDCSVAQSPNPPVSDADCRSESVKSTMDMLGVRIGDVWCSQGLLNYVVPGFAFYELAAVRSDRFNPQTASVGRHLAVALEIARSGRAKTPYISTGVRFHGIRNLPESIRSLEMTLLLRSGDYSTPEVLVLKVERSMCAPDAYGLDPGGALFTALTQKFGSPPSSTTSNAELAIAEKTRLRALESLVEEKSKEDPRYRSVAIDSVREAKNKLAAAERLAAQAPTRTSAVTWMGADKATVVVRAVATGTCENGHLPLHMELDGTSMIESIARTAMKESAEAARRPADPSKVKL